VRGAEAAGLGLLDVTTTFGADKVLRLHDDGGYEIHHGRVEVGDVDEFLGGARDGRVFGTMHHGSLESDEFRRAFLGDVAASAGRAYVPSTASFAVARAARLDLLGDLAEKHLDVDALLALARDGAPDVPVLPPGSAA
jgi:adenosylcobyric acid synthase